MNELEKDLFDLFKICLAFDAFDDYQVRVHLDQIDRHWLDTYMLTPMMTVVSNLVPEDEYHFKAMFSLNLGGEASGNFVIDKQGNQR